MLQWMGGGRRKVKTTRKSVEARQRHFFEQRRQKLRSEAAEPLAISSSQRQDNIYSLDIASLKNLSRLAQEAIGTENFDSDGAKKSKLLAGGDVHGNNRNYCTGNEPISLETTFDPAVISKRNVGTQWTPASAAAAAASTDSLIRTGVQSAFERRPISAVTRGLEEQKITGKSHVTRNKKDSLEPKKSMKNETKLTALEMNVQQQNNQVHGKKKLEKNFAELDILDVVCGNEIEERNKKPSCELYATSLLKGGENVCSGTLENEITISAEEMNQEINSTYASKVSLPIRGTVTPECSMMVSSACTSGSCAIDSPCQYEASNLGESNAFSIFSHSTDASYSSFDDIDATKIKSIGAVCCSSGITGQRIANVHDGVFGILDSLDWIGAPSYEETFSCSGQNKSIFQIDDDISLDQPETNIFSECNSFMTTCNFEMGKSSPRFFEQLTAHINMRNPDVESVLYSLTDDDDDGSKRTDIIQHTCNTFDSLEYQTEEERFMMDRFRDTASTSTETCLERTDSEGTDIAVIDHFQTWILSKKPKNRTSMFSNFFKRLDNGRDNLICDPKVSGFSINAEMMDEIDSSIPSTAKETLSTSTISLPKRRICKKACYLLEYQEPETFKVMEKENCNRDTRSPSTKVSQGNIRNLDKDEAERIMKVKNSELTGDANSHASSNQRNSQPAAHGVIKNPSNTVFTILSRLQKPVKHVKG